MFDLKAPCGSCPFRKGWGERFRLTRPRLMEIITAVAFQCHATVDYSDDRPSAGSKPQQCAGLMTVLHRSGRENPMMQIASRLNAVNLEALDPTDAVYDDLEAMFRAHGHEPPSEDEMRIATLRQVRGCCP